jgi:Flp pilus assembly protein TadG
MTRDRRLMVRLFLRDDNGQILPMVALMMVAFIGMTGLVVDAGHLYVAYN